MRLSSIVSILVVTASFALGGCAADAEPSDGDGQPNVALGDKSKVELPDESRLEDSRQTGSIGDLYENPTDETKARQVEKYKTGLSNPRLEIQPSVFGNVPREKIGAVPPQFQPLNVWEQAIDLEPGYLPYSNRPDGKP